MKYKILAPGMIYYENVINDAEKTIETVEYIQEKISNGAKSAIEPWHEWNGANPDLEKFCKRYFLTDPKNLNQSDIFYNEARLIYDNIFNGINDAYMHYSSQLYPLASQNIKSTEGLLSILKYGKTGYLPEHQDQGVSSRVLSTVGYLNDNYDGGEIYFPYIDIEVKPTAGSVLFFPSNFIFVHTVKPIQSGYRYAVPQWYHSLKVPRMSTGEV
jgi:hypothetical protein